MSAEIDTVNTVEELSTFLGLVAEDLNGECFVAGAEGEIEELIGSNIVYFPHDSPAAKTERDEPTFTGHSLMAFVICNSRIDLPVGVNRTVVDRIKIAYIRYLAARVGLISPYFSTAANNVKYNDAVFLSKDATDKLISEALADKAYLRVVANVVTHDFKARARLNFTDYVCCVAYMFRVRGHHFKDDFHSRYETLWARCLKTSGELVLPWQFMATDALHGIMPNMLDNYWQEAVDNAWCSGTLVKRYDSAPAGVAGVFALKRGLDDVMMIFPGAVNNVPGAYATFSALIRRLETNRWVGSINARYYGVERIRFSEAEFGVLASVCMGIYDQLAPDSKLRDSPALSRLAEVAPATGGAIGLAARNATADPRINLLDMAPNVARVDAVE